MNSKRVLMLNPLLPTITQHCKFTSAHYHILPAIWIHHQYSIVLQQNNCTALTREKTTCKWGLHFELVRYTVLTCNTSGCVASERSRYRPTRPTDETASASSALCGNILSYTRGALHCTAEAKASSRAPLVKVKSEIGSACGCGEAPARAAIVQITGSILDWWWAASVQCSRTRVCGYSCVF